jgi:aspartyl-tRNA(Asn)/glutamyl-tRNA(Gln) amidotransferase subunit B
LTQDRGIADYFEDVCSSVKGNNYKSASNWIMTEVMRILNDEKIPIEKFHISGKNLSSLVNMIAEGKISNNIAKEVFAEMLNITDGNDEKQDPEKIVSAKDLLQVTDTSEIEIIVKKVIEENPEETKRYKNGEVKLLGFFVGKVMKESKGKANPKAVNELIISNLG